MHVVLQYTYMNVNWKDRKMESNVSEESEDEKLENQY